MLFLHSRALAEGLSQPGAIALGQALKSRESLKGVPSLAPNVKKTFSTLGILQKCKVP
jgi:hypothetical protein